MHVSGKKIFVGLSGGVDSAVSAGLLKKDGAQVTGVFIQGWYPEGMPCTWKEDRQDAMRVAAHLGIPFKTLDASKEYKQGVIDYLLREYKAGRTPNPDVMCNREVKFGAFVRYAKEQGADAIATGHYAHTKDSFLFRGVDESKDQSYFLWAVPKETLAYTLFPLGTRKKKETRQLAEKFQLPNAVKRDSQGICFLGSVSVDDFLKKEFGTAVGVVRTEDGTELSTHEGVHLYTLGQRIALPSAPAGPWYVVKKDIEKNILVVSHTAHKPIGTGVLTLSSINYFHMPTEGEVLSAQYRYHGPSIEGVLRENGTCFEATAVSEPLSIGQSLVLYRGNECVGGGIIERSD